MKQFKVKTFSKKKPPEEKKPLEEVVKEELNEFQTAFHNRMVNEGKNIDKLTSTGYWFCAYFADFEQCQEFLRKAGLQNLMEGQYINGQMMAEKLDIKIEKKKISPPPSFKKHKDFTSLCV
jgi:hypothetical protein